MRRRLGFAQAEADDEALVRRLLQLMQASAVDYTNFFRELSESPAEQAVRRLRADFVHLQGFDAWAADYFARTARQGREPGQPTARIQRGNPRNILLHPRALNSHPTAEQRHYQLPSNLTSFP